MPRSGALSMGLCAWSPDAEGHLESPDVVGRMFRSRKTQGSHLWPIFLVKQEGRSCHRIGLGRLCRGCWKFEEYGRVYL